MWVAGLVLILLAIVGVLVAQRFRSRVRAMTAAETIPVAELEEHRDALAGLGTAGGFRKVCEVVGTAEPGPGGPLRSALTDTECV